VGGGVEQLTQREGARTQVAGTRGLAPPCTVRVRYYNLHLRLRTQTHTATTSVVDPNSVGSVSFCRIRTSIDARHVEKLINYTFSPQNFSMLLKYKTFLTSKAAT
jgi:hypothetical protein